MNVSLLWWCLLATCIFWGVGLYNRLTRLRERTMEAFGQLDKHMKALAQFVQEQVDPSQAVMGYGNEPLVVEAHWAELYGLAIALAEGLKASRPSPLNEESMVRLDAAHRALQMAWMALNDLPADLAGSAVPEQVRQQWDTADLKVQAARIGLQEVAQSYNESLNQFPARIAARAMGFRPAAAIEI